MYTLTVTCQKGGTGKTTTALAVGAELDKAGYRVLFVDTDQQANLTRTQLEKPFTVGLYDVLTDKKISTAQGITDSRNGHILPSDSRMGQGGKYSPLYGSEPEYRLKNALQAVADQYDVCIIDTPPTLGELTIAALTAADGVIVPTRADRYSVYGVQELYQTFQTVKQQTTNHSVKMLGVVVTQYNGRATLARDVLETLKDQARKLGTKVYEPPIRATIAATEWQYLGYQGTSTAARDYAEITQQLITDMKLKRR